MPTEWYYTRAGQQQGPVSQDELQRMLQSGQITSADLVWNESMPQWTPASKAPGLSGPTPAPYAPSAPYPASVLQYAAPTSDGVVASPRALDILRKTRPWARTMSIVIFILAGLGMIGSITTMFVANQAGRRESGVMMGVSFFYLSMAILSIMPGVFLSRYASRISTLLRMGRSADLEAALEAQKSFWKFVAIATLIVIVLYFVAVAIAVSVTV